MIQSGNAHHDYVGHATMHPVLQKPTRVANISFFVSIHCGWNKNNGAQIGKRCLVLPVGIHFLREASFMICNCFVKCSPYMLAHYHQILKRILEYILRRITCRMGRSNMGACSKYTQKESWTLERRMLV